MDGCFLDIIYEKVTNTKVYNDGGLWILILKSLQALIKNDSYKSFKMHKPIYSSLPFVSSPV